MEDNRTNSPAIDDAIFKLIYLAYCNIKKKWAKPIANRIQPTLQLAIAFDNRFQIMWQNNKSLYKCLEKIEKFRTFAALKKKCDELFPAAVLDNKALHSSIDIPDSLKHVL